MFNDLVNNTQDMLAMLYNLVNNIQGMLVMFYGSEELQESLTKVIHVIMAQINLLYSFISPTSIL